eukprot:258946_1
MAVDLMHLLAITESDKYDDFFISPVEINIFDNQMNDDFFGSPTCLIYGYIRDKCGIQLYHHMQIDVALLCGLYIGLVNTRNTLKIHLKEIIHSADLLDNCMHEYKRSHTLTVCAEIRKQIQNLLANASKSIKQTKDMFEHQRNKILKWERNVHSIKVIEFNNLIYGFQRAIQILNNSLNASYKILKKPHIRCVQLIDSSSRFSESEIEKLIFQTEHDDYISFLQNTFTNQFCGMFEISDSFIDRMFRLESEYNQLMEISQTMCEFMELCQALNSWIVDDEAMSNQYDSSNPKKLRIIEKKIKNCRTFTYTCMLLTVLIIVFIIIVVFA